jgi:hypothetical protein
VPVFVVERFLPGLTVEGVRAQARREQAILGLRYLRTTYLCNDELCFVVVEAPSLDAVREANSRMGMEYERITEAIEVTEDVASMPIGPDEAAP